MQGTASESSPKAAAPDLLTRTVEAEPRFSTPALDMMSGD